MAGMNNPPGTPRDDGEMAGNFLNPFQSESVSTKEDSIPLKLETRLYKVIFSCDKAKNHMFKSLQITVISA